MSYKNKLRKRLYLAFGYIVVGALMCVPVIMSGEYDSFWAPFAVAFVVCGIFRIVDYFRITRDEKAMRRQEIEETDERNLEISQRAKSMAINIYIIIAGIAVVALKSLNMPEMSIATAFNICLLVMLYWICHLIVKSKT